MTLQADGNAASRTWPEARVGAAQESEDLAAALCEADAVGGEAYPASGALHEHGPGFFLKATKVVGDRRLPAAERLCRGTHRSLTLEGTRASRRRRSIPSTVSTRSIIFGYMNHWTNGTVVRDPEGMTIAPPTAPVSFDGVLAAADALHAHLEATPTWRYEALSRAVGRDVVVKHENMQPTGSFKVRGGLTLAAQLDADERRAGLVTCSTGNHAQSIAFAARLAGTRAVIVMPHCAPSVKVDAVRALGAQVVLEGERLPDASAHARALAAESGMRFVDPGNEPAMIHGHAIVYLELLQAHPEVEEILVPIGSGSGAAGACLVRDAIAPNVRVVGVQAVGAPAAHDSWAGDAEVARPAETRVSGLATGCGFATPQSILRGARGSAGNVGLAAFELVPDDAIDDAAHVLATHAHLLAEGAAAASLAGLRARQERYGEAQGGSVAVVVTVAMSALTSGSGSRAGDASLDGAPQAMGAKHPRWEGYEAPTEGVLLPSAEMLPSVSRPASGRGRGSTRGLRVNRSHSP